MRIQLGFTARSIVCDNPTNQWIYLVNLDTYIPPYTIRACYPVAGSTQTAQAQWGAPVGLVNPPIIPGQYATLNWYSIDLPPSGGFGITGNRAPYYDRNPISRVLGLSFQTGTLSGNDGASSAVFTYVPGAGRKAYLESLFCRMELLTTDTAADAAIGARVSFTAATIPGLVTLINAKAITGHTKETVVDIELGSNMEMQTGDELRWQAFTNRGAGFNVNAEMEIGIKLTEFDA